MPKFNLSPDSSQYPSLAHKHLLEDLLSKPAQWQSQKLLHRHCRLKHTLIENMSSLWYYWTSLLAVPIRWSLARNWWTSVLTMRDPLMPMGWPSATAPPSTLTRSWGTSSNCWSRSKVRRHKEEYQKATNSKRSASWDGTVPSCLPAQPQRKLHWSPIDRPMSWIEQQYYFKQLHHIRPSCQHIRQQQIRRLLVALLALLQQEQWWTQSVPWRHQRNLQSGNRSVRSFPSNWSIHTQPLLRQKGWITD